MDKNQLIYEENLMKALIRRANLPLEVNNVPLKPYQVLACLLEVASQEAHENLPIEECFHPDTLAAAKLRVADAKTTLDYSKNPLIRQAAPCRMNQYTRFCETCGAPASLYLANSELIEARPEAEDEDYWAACDNEKCEQAYGEAYDQAEPLWVKYSR